LGLIKLAVEIAENNLLIHELQLGEQLNACVHSKRRSDFSLLLSMLTDNVKEHSQFFVPDAIEQTRVVTEDSLRKEFHLPKKVELGLKSSSDLTAFNQAELIKENRLTELHLMNVLQPKPLAYRDDVAHINYEVLSNTSLYCQKKIQRQNNASQIKFDQDEQRQNQSQEKNEQDLDKLLNQKLLFDANAWLDTVQTSIVKSYVC